MNTFVNYLLNEKIIDDREVRIVKYGIKSILLNASNIVSILLISFFNGNFIKGLLFLIFFIPIRVLIGGYHCKSAGSCFVCFNLFYLLVLNFSNHIDNKLQFIVCIFLIILLIMQNNYFSSKKQHLKSRKYFVLKNSVLVLYLIILLLFNFKIVENALFIAMIMNSILFFLVKYV